MPASFGLTEGLMKSTALIPQTEQEVAQELVSSHPLVSKGSSKGNPGSVGKPGDDSGTDRQGREGGRGL